ncbi:unnamed protein product [Periconia digitata]|uniref:Uncharacterized protein n=1 Tax=Periconia digitata TaxID=1303443 RepID=A0A9W4UUR0_9PLEO|nr:unnamed protein product [Periconia digitata]
MAMGADVHTNYITSTLLRSTQASSVLTLTPSTKPISIDHTSLLHKTHRTMSSSSTRPEPKAERKRPPRRRLPPLPPGPKLQFVVANRPEDFRSNATMRNVRSHVMYKHRTVSPSNSVRSVEQRIKRNPETRTPSPTATAMSDGIIEDFNYVLPPGNSHDEMENPGSLYHSSLHTSSDGLSRDLTSKIIASLTEEPTRSAPATLDYGTEFPFSSGIELMNRESLRDLRDQYIYHVVQSSTQGNPEASSYGTTWVKLICSNHMSFLSHVSIVCAYQDVMDGFLTDTALTQCAKAKVLSMITESMVTRKAQTDDFTIMSIVNLLVSHIGDRDERVIDVHQEGLARIVQERGGLLCLGLDGRVATCLTVVLLIFTVLRGLSEPAMLVGFPPALRVTENEGFRCISPLYAPQGDLTSLYGSCSSRTYDLISDMHNATRIFIARWDCTSDALSSIPQHQLMGWDMYMEQTYSKVVNLPSSAGEAIPDWVYESCRLAALIYCGCMIRGVSLSEASEATDPQQPDSGTSSTTILTALQNALRQTNPGACWGNMGGALLWICLVGGRAAWPSAAWTRKFFALHAVRVSHALCCPDSAAVIETQRTMLKVQALVGARRTLSPPLV